MSFITRITVPISNYYRDDVFEAHLYYECENQSPTKEQVIKNLEDDIEKYKSDLEVDLEDTYEILEVVKNANDWCFVTPTSIVQTNTFVNHPQFGEQPLSFAIINPTKL